MVVAVFFWLRALRNQLRSITNHLQRQKITAAIEWHCKGFQDHPRSALNSILDRERSTIKIDKLKSINEVDQPILINDSDEILDKTRQIFKDALFSNGITNFDSIDTQWQNEYAPMDRIKN